VQADDPVLRNWRPVWFWDMPAPAPPPRLTARRADVHAGTPDETAVVPVVPELVALELAPAELAPAAGLEELDELAPVAPVEAVDPADVEDEAAQPAARSPALSSGTTSNAFFTTFSLRQRQDDALMSLMTPQHRTRLGLFPGSGWRPSRREAGAVSPAAGDASFLWHGDCRVTAA